MLRLIGWLVLVCGVLSFTAPAPAGASQHRVYIIQIHNEIDLGLAAYLKRALGDAAGDDAAAVILDINTPGGRLDATLEMRDAILDADVRTIAFVNREAFSAGALITLAAEEIFMTPASVFGAATPVTGAGETADEKVVSAVRSVFRSTAEHRGRDPRVAEAMVDPEVAIDGLIPAGRLLTLSTTEAMTWGYTDGIVANQTELLAATGLESAEIEVTSIRLAERLVRVLTNPVIASLLISLGSLMILIDLFTAGFGVVGAIGIGMIATFFWGHFLAGLAGWEGVVLVGIGLALLVAEALVVPGFGIAGLLGIAALLGGMFISLISDEIVTDQDVTRAGLTVGAAGGVIVIGAVLMLWLLPHATRFRGLILQSQVGLPDVVPERRKRRRWWSADQPEVTFQTDVPPEPVPQSTSLTGARGRALSDLRPGGFASINAQRVDVVTRGDFIPAGSPIEVIADEGYRRVVRQLEDDDEPLTDMAT